MKKNAFTLVELLGVITVLAFIALITIPIITQTISNSKETLYNQQKKQIEKASENWFIKTNYTVEGNEKIIVDIDTLTQSGYLSKKEVTNPKTSTKMGGCVLITFESNQYQYNYEETSCTCNSGEACNKY